MNINMIGDKIKQYISPKNKDCITIIRNCLSELKKRHKESIGVYIPVKVIKETLFQMGIKKGDIIHVHSSIDRLAVGYPPDLKSNQEYSILQYAVEIITMLKELVGTDGTIFMNTESIPRSVVNQLWRNEPTEYVFDYKKSKSRRGLI